jgi:hypothetical protein
VVIFGASRRFLGVSVVKEKKPFTRANDSG